MSVQREDVIRALGRIVEPSSGKDLIRQNMVKDLRVDEDAVSFTIIVKDPSSGFAKQVPEAARRVLHEEVSRDLKVDVTVDNEMISLGDDVQVSGGGQQKESSEPVHTVNTIAVASGKGGVGKSTVAANLAVALAKQGHAVGLVDTDIYGPSVPTMFGVKGEKPRVNENKKIVPLERHGVKLLSMGFMVDPKQAVIWRGPMVSRAVKQFLGDAEWGELDYLILDLPPGTGDIQLTIVQTISLTGAVIVSTPQEVALADARKGVEMFRKVQVPVLGIVENMAYFTPPDLPDRKYHLFGQGGARRLAEDTEVPFLGEVPIEQSVRESGDDGTPIVLADEESLSAAAFGQIAERTAEQVAIRNAEGESTQKIEILYR